jgi:hypothetical protein
MNSDIRKSLSAHYSDMGLQLSCTTSSLRRLLKNALGNARLNAWDDLVEAVRSGHTEPVQLYSFLNTAEEVNLAFSFQSGLTLENTIWLAGQVAAHYEVEMRIGELGSCSGLFASWLATQYPKSSVIGFDAIESLIAIADHSTELDNLKFHLWDYRNPFPKHITKSDCLVSALGIDFEYNESHDAIDPSQLRSSDCYIAKKNDAATYFQSWRGAIEDGGHLFTVLRISSHSHFIAVCDAATENGWSVVLQDSIHLKYGVESIPGMVFVADAASDQDVDELLEFWCNGEVTTSFELPLYGAAAIAAFNKLDQKTTIESDSKTFEGDGHTMATSIGTSGEIGFSFSMATTGFARLEIVPTSGVTHLGVNFV